MTYEEAYKILTEHTRNYVGLKDAEALEVAIQAVKKQIPKKPNIRKAGYKSLDYVCPECGYRRISRIDGEWIAGVMSNNCPNCGQALDWSDTE